MKNVRFNNIVEHTDIDGTKNLSYIKSYDGINPSYRIMLNFIDTFYKDNTRQKIKDILINCSLYDLIFVKDKLIDLSKRIDENVKRNRLYTPIIPYVPKIQIPNYDHTNIIIAIKLIDDYFLIDNDLNIITINDSSSLSLDFI